MRGGEQRSDPVIDDTFKNMMERLDPEEFMEVRSGLIIHQSAIVDDGRMQRNGNRQVELVDPYEKYDKSGDCLQVKRFDVPKRRVSTFQKWTLTTLKFLDRRGFGRIFGTAIFVSKVQRMSGKIN